MELALWEIGVLVAVCGCAGFVQRVSGFGFGIFAMLFLPHLLPHHTDAATISGLCSLFSSSYNAICYRKDIHYRAVLPMLAAALTIIPFAVYVSGQVSGTVFRMLLGGVLILLGLFFLFMQKKVHIRATLPNGLLAGSLGGALSGLFSTGGPPAVLYLTHATAEPIVYLATIQFYFSLTNVFATGMRVVGGMVTVSHLLFAGLGFLGALVGNDLGRRVFDRLDGEKLKRIIYIGMMISGALMFL